jgi:hypothetical protein
MPDSKELLDEFKSVFSGNGSLLDTLLPPIAFLIVNLLFGFQSAVWSSLTASAFVMILRLFRKQKLIYAFGGLAAALLAIGLRYWLNSANAFFLPGLINGALTTIVLLVSIIAKRPVVAFTSALTRRWPLGWYWHPSVRPAYSEVTAIWVIYSAGKLAIQYWFYIAGNLNGLALLNLLGGWPALIVLLIISYIYGLRRLKQLEGPSIEEYKALKTPPWQGQQRGF